MRIAFTLSPAFHNECPAARRATFQFTADGTRQTGIVYVTRNISPGQDTMAAATAAAQVAGRRAGAAEVCLHRIQTPLC